MPPPTTAWICDACGELIDSDGWVEWSPGDQARRIRIVHHRLECQSRSNDISDFSLKEFQGDDGLMYSLEKIFEGHFELQAGIEFIKRVHVSGYEGARLHIDDAIAEGVIEPNNHKMFLSQEDLQDVLDYVRSME